jgi:hypothetical protein
MPAMRAGTGALAGTIHCSTLAVHWPYTVHLPRYICRRAASLSNISPLVNRQVSTQSCNCTCITGAEQGGQARLVTTNESTKRPKHAHACNLALNA